MFDLFNGELLRFRTWTLAAAMLHLLVLGFFSRLVDLAQQPLPVYQVFAISYFLVGVLLGLYQMGSYRRPNQWLNLLHRPMHRLRIAGALASACALLLLLATALPIAVIACYQDTMTARVLDLRHWLLPLAAWLVALCGYAAGAYAMLGNRRHSFAAMLLPNLFMFSTAFGLAMIAVQLCVLAYLGLLIALAFRPDPMTPSRHPAAAIVAALPVQVAAYFGLWMLGFAVELGWTMSGTHPLSAPQAPKGGHIEADRADGKQMLLLGLAGSRLAEAALWREQIALSEVITRYPLRSLPKRGEMTNVAPMEFDDQEQGVRWVFSHDRMRFAGYGTLDKRARGELGADETQAAFPAPTLQYTADYLFNAQAAYQYDASQKRLFERLRLPAGEVMASPPEPAGDNLLLLSDRAAYFYPGREAANGLDRMRPLLRVAMPGPVGNLSRVDAIELLDGYLISFTYTWGVWAGELQHPYQQVLRVDNAGKTSEVARRAIGKDLPVAYTTRVWWLSPALRNLCLAAQDLFAGPDPLRASPQPVPRSALRLALACALLSLLAASWLSGRQQHSRIGRWGWVLCCGVVGLPALLSLWLIHPRRETLPVAAAHAQPSPA
jgi:hypothetical protein